MPITTWNEQNRKHEFTLTGHETSCRCEDCAVEYQAWIEEGERQPVLAMPKTDNLSGYGGKMATKYCIYQGWHN